MIETLPCGYFDPDNGVTSPIHEVEFEEMTGYEEDILGDKSKHTSGMAINEVLSRCLVRIGDLKPEKPTRGKFFLPHLDKMLVGDRTYLLIRLRQLSLGDSFAFETKCPACKVRIPRFTVDLASLTVKPMEDPTKREWNVTLPSSKLGASFRALVGADERALNQIRKQKKEDFFSSLLMLRLTELGGDKVSSVTQLKKLTVKDRDFLRGQFDKIEGGIDTQIQCACESCGHEWEMVLPIGEHSFFFPSGISA